VASLINWTQVGEIKNKKQKKIKNEFQTTDSQIYNKKKIILYNCESSKTLDGIHVRHISPLPPVLVMLIIFINPLAPFVVCRVDKRRKNGKNNKAYT
jgi:hypothetical protein